MDADALRAEFPVLERVAFMNAGTDGPVPRRAAEAAQAEVERQLLEGRAGKAHFEHLQALDQELRVRVAGLAGCSPDELALTGSTTDGVNTVLAALDLREGDEVLTGDEEHPGVLAPLALAARRRGIRVRTAPFGELASAITPATRLVATSHVSWVSGRVVDHAALAASHALVLLDGAQALGAVPVDLRALGCDFYAASGQKWLCGPDHSGYLYVRGELLEEMLPPWPGYASLEDPGRPLALQVHPGARRFDLTPAAAEGRAWSIASFDTLARAGWDRVVQRGPALAARLAELLAEAGREVAPRGHTTLVSWRSADPEAEVERLAAEGIVVRHLPGRGLVRASVGAWSNEREVERVAAATSGS